jgi:thiol-disulfide isomerase/thioredoxin
METGNLYAINYKDGMQEIDTLKVKNSKFIYERTIEGKVKTIFISTQTERRLASDPFIDLYLEPTIMDISLDVSNIKGAKLTGSKSMDDNYRLEDARSKIKEKFSTEFAAFDANREQLSKATTEEEKKKLKWKDDDLRSALEPYYEESNKLMKDFIVNNPESYISYTNFMYALKQFSQEEAWAIYDKFPSEFKQGDLSKRIEKEIDDMSKGIPGAMAGNFNTVDINGKPIKLDDFKGQYLLIDFWASWCVPCRKGNPHLLDLYVKYNSKGLEILGVSDDDSNPDAWRKAVEEDGIGVWRHVLRGMKVDRSNGGFKLLDDGISGGYNISTLPTKILINPDGVIVGRYGGGGGTDEDMDKKLAEIFINK